MSLRPRYSLLTLLVITALVAGICQWQNRVYREVVDADQGLTYYWYYINILGQKRLHGSYVERSSYSGGQHTSVTIQLYRRGSPLPDVRITFADNSFAVSCCSHKFSGPPPALSDQELRDFANCCKEEDLLMQKQRGARTFACYGNLPRDLFKYYDKAKNNLYTD
jgi:hypothetical protein